MFWCQIYHTPQYFGNPRENKSFVVYVGPISSQSYEPLLDKKKDITEIILHVTIYAYMLIYNHLQQFFSGIILFRSSRLGTTACIC